MPVLQIEEKLKDIFDLTEKINHIKDIDILLERILYESRRLVNADAGSIYLVAGNKLEFSYVQNDSIKREPSKTYYKNERIDIDERSITGYCAKTKKYLIIDNVYDICPELPCFHDKSFDVKYSYRTVSVLTIPIITGRDDMIGVLQLINKKDREGKVAAFTENDRLMLNPFITNAAASIEKAKMTRELVLRMVRMSEFRDPKETGMHVHRVAAYSIEIYKRWGEVKNINPEDIKHSCDILRIAAMLHDVGKVGIPDHILKKNDRLDSSEFEQMKLHTKYGHMLFSSCTSDWDEMSAEIALNHHEKWDGTGYPGAKKGKDIPLMGRIVAIADVYDALLSRRSYKDSWSEEDVFEYIMGQKGKQFDPELVDIFLSIHDIIRSVKEKYPYDQI